MATLCVARLLVATMPFKWWRRSIGGTAGRRRLQPLAIDAERLAAHVDWAAKLLPFTTKCLPRAMALSWMLRPRGVAHSVVFAVRPAGLRGDDDQLHAWVEWSGRIILGELPGPWVETLRVGAEPACGATKN